MRRFLLPLLAIAAVVLVAAPGALAAKPVAKPSYLFAMTSTGGSLAHDASGWWVTLMGTSPMVTRFTDRPGRQAATMTPTQLANRWRAYGFAEDAPNAALVLDGRSAASDVYVVELRNPRVEGSTVRFRARPLHTASHALRHYVKRADRLSETTFGRASLFIDDGGETVYQQLTLQFQNVTPGQAIAVDLTGDGGFPVTFSTGSDLAPTYAGVSFDAQPGLSITAFTIAGGAIRLNTAPSGSGAPQAFALDIYLASTEGINDFLLTNASDPGIVVTAVTASSMGLQQQVLSSVPTQLFWAN